MSQPRIDSSFAFAFIAAIKNGIFHPEAYPAAYIDPRTNALCVACSLYPSQDAAPADSSYDHYDAVRDEDLFQHFSQLFEELCKRHDIAKLPNAAGYAQRRETTMPDGMQIIKYEFNIAPGDMEKLLTEELPYYPAYRSGASIARLQDPESIDFKDGVICFFPALVDEDTDEYVPRNAGCNMSEIISVQLANYIKHYLLPDSDVPAEAFFGHHNSVITRDFLHLDEKDILNALAKCINLERLTHQKEIDLPIKSSDTPMIQVCDLDAESRGIYQRLTVCPPDELAHTKSCEIPIEDFLDQLVIVVKSSIATLRSKAADEFSQRDIKRYEAALEQIAKLKDAIAAKTAAKPFKHP